MENAALRMQLAAFQRMRKRPVLTTFDRLFWVGLSRVWRGWRSPLLYVKPTNHPENAVGLALYLFFSVDNR